MLTREQYIWNYKEQLKLFSQMILARIEEIVSESTRPLIMVIQGDHGPASLDQPGVSIGARAYERHSILNAYLVPNRTCARLYPRISPVNTFRVILNSHFGANLALLEDRSFYSQFSSPYDFTEVTLEPSVRPSDTELTESTNTKPSPTQHQRSMSVSH